MVNCQKNQWLLRGQSYKEKYDKNILIHRYKGRDSTLCYTWHNLSVPFLLPENFIWVGKEDRGPPEKQG